eukprot:jgi/Psemu1/6948/gm1.6948_g
MAAQPLGSWRSWPRHSPRLLSQQARFKQETNDPKTPDHQRRHQLALLVIPNDDAKPTEEDVTEPLKTPNQPNSTRTLNTPNSTQRPHCA